MTLHELRWPDALGWQLEHVERLRAAVKWADTTRAGFDPAGLRLTVGAADLIQNRLAVLEETLVLRYFFCNRVLLLVTYENPRIHTFPAGLLRAQSKPTFRRCAGSP